MKKLYWMIGLLLVFVLGIGVAAAQSDTTAPVTQTGDVIQLQGQVTDTDGNPIAGAVVEIWQTDINGNYNHPNDSAASDLLSDFQYFGTATTDEAGYYAFLTVRPGEYEPRPTHIHVKVKIDGVEVLTTQFYFEDERAAVEADGAFANAGDTLFLQVSEGTGANGDPITIATGNIVLDMNGDAADTLTPTATQTEGPYYPVVDFSGYDNNLLDGTTDDTPVLPILAADMTSAPFTLLNLNTASNDEILAIPGLPSRMVREFNEYRPYVSIQQFRREIGKYIGADQVAAYEQYVYVPIDVNNADAATLMQIPGLDEAAANQLIALRPFADNDAFLAALANAAPGVDRAYAANYLEAQ